ncbi:GbNV_gp59-like [Fopius arisanus]|nr:GbNV_gp59-like [Fopius arisanus]
MDTVFKSDTRDDRFKHLIEAQLGTNGINVLVANSFLLIFSLIIVMLASVGYVTTQTGTPHYTTSDDRMIITDMTWISED